MYFYEILEEIMREKGLNVPDVARACDLSDGTVRSMLVRKAKSVTLEVAFKMADGLGISLERLNGLPEHKDAPAQAIASTGAESIDALQVYELLANSGFVKNGADLSDADLRFLLSVGEALRSWFAKGDK